MTQVEWRAIEGQRIDGRVARGSRNREAIVDALLACYGDGILRPSAAEIAERAGVSARSVHNHFADVEALRAEVAQRQWEHVANIAEAPDVEGDLRSRIRALVDRRAELFDAVTPVRRAALLSVHESPIIAANLARLDRRLRRQLERVFAAELATGSPDVLEALDAAVSWDTWNRLRTAQGCSVARARRIVTTMLSSILEGKTT